MAKLPFRLMLITDRTRCKGRDLLEIVRTAAAAGLPALQLREKDLSPRDLWEWAHRLKDILTPYGTRLLINDRPDIARSIGAFGVHLPEQGVPVKVARTVMGPESLIGVSVHSLGTALRAADEGADYVLFGAVYNTPGKVGQGLRALSQVCHNVSLPVLAIGGIKPEHVSQCLDAGAVGVAVVSAITQSPDVTKTVEQFLNFLQSAQ